MTSTDEGVGYGGMVVTSEASELVYVEKRKYPDVIRTTFEAYPLGSDRWGEWLSVPDRRALLLLPSGPWWVAWYRQDGSMRVDIATEVVTGEGGVRRGDVPPGNGRRSFVDLDLDIERESDGTVHILDEDQFAERCGAYPQSWVPVARQALVEAANRARRREEPFDRAHYEWIAAAGWPGYPSIESVQMPTMPTPG